MSQIHYQRIFKSPINTSISKNLYSFSKTERFSKARQSPCTRSFYEIKSPLNSARTTSFGFGHRSELTNKQTIPDPGQYEYNSNQFNQNKYKKRGFSFGIQIKKGFPYQKHQHNPGPGKYESFYKQNNGYSIRSKYEDPLENNKNSLGPGQYRVTENLSKTGNYFNSKHRGSLCGKFGKSIRFDDDRTLSPGPGTYKDKLSINRSGSYFNSRIKSNYVPSFEGTYRPSITKQNCVPGPGAYYNFTQFGSRFMQK